VLQVVVMPTGIAEDVVELIAPTRSVPGVAEHIDPFMKCDAKGIVRFNIPGEAEADRVGRIFGLKGAEKSVPDDKRAAVVAVNVAGIGTVVDAMVRGSVEDSFERAHGADQFGVNPELVQQADGFHGHDHDGWETDYGKPKPENEAHKAAGPGLAQRRGEVIALRGVMYNVGGPEEAALMADAVKPVVAELVAKKEQAPRPPLEADVEDRKVIQVREN